MIAWRLSLPRGSAKGISSRILLVVALGIVAAYFGMLGVTGQLEQDNHFWLACHLHQSIYEDYYSPGDQIVSLAAGHPSGDSELRYMVEEKVVRHYERCHPEL